MKLKVIPNTKAKRMTKIKWFDHGKIMRGMALIGKNGQIRFKKELAAGMGFAPGQRWKIGVNEAQDTLYFIKPKKGDEENGFKMCFQNKSWFLSGGTVVKELKLNPPLRGIVEPYKDDDMEGFTMKLPAQN